MRAAALLAVVAFAVACQPAGGPGQSPATPDGGRAGDRPLGAPVTGLPATLDELLSRAEVVAREWQADPVLAEVEVDLDDARRWTAARLTYLAADADRFLSLVTTGSGFSQQHPTLETFGLQAVTAEGLAQLEPVPDDAAEPAALAEQAEAAGCGPGDEPTVLYVTGAPVAWDGTQWSADPNWRVTVTGAEGAGAALDVDGAGEVRCLD